MSGVIQLIAVDPGSEQSAYVAFDDAGALLRHGKLANEEMLRQLAREQSEGDATTTLAIEMIASYGMAVGSEVFETCVWIGRFVQIWPGPCVRVYRRDVKLHLCADSRAKDSNIRQAIIDRYGPGKGRAIGTKKQPGPLYAVTADVWSALGVALTVLDGAVRSAA